MTADGQDTPPEIHADRLDAVIFDLDGVITDTASVHAGAWKQMFDSFLASRDGAPEESHRPFSDDDYRRYVDGKPRYDGVESFLASRQIDLPRGESGDPSSAETVCGLGNRKDELFLERLREDGVEAFPSSRELLEALRRGGFGTAIISASRNCAQVLEAADATDLFDLKVDGLDADRLGLRGKPDPAVFLEAARLLGVEPARAAVVEDAHAGVEAGRSGGFGLVIGVDRTGHPEELEAHGADVVVADLAEVRLAPGEGEASGEGASGSPLHDDWLLAYEGFDPEQEPLREILCALGNGLIATRAAAPETDAGGVHYPGTYATGVYNRLSSEVAGREVADESNVNLPNWLSLTFRIEDGEWFDTSAVELADYRQELDLRSAVLTRRIRFTDGEGRETSLVERRFVSMSDPNVLALETTLTPLNWSGRVTFRSALDGRVTNSGVQRYAGLDNRHLAPIETRAIDPHTILLEVETSQSHVRVAEAARTRLLHRGDTVPVRLSVTEEDAWIGMELEADAVEGRPLTGEKVAMLYTSHEPAVAEPGLEAANDIAVLPGFDELLREHMLRWDELWDICLLELEDDNELVTGQLRLQIFHLLGTVSEHTAEMDAGVPARGLAGEAYRGHIFWDALFIFPFLNLRLPNLTRALIRYRYRRLNAARRNARAAGHDGAAYPWQSGADGTELTPTVHLNPRSGRWMPDNSRLQRHIDCAIAYDVWLFYQATADVEFLALYGAEIFIEIARFLASIAAYDRSRDRYVIRGVVGPDEYHDAYPDSERPGIDNNAYTNAMAAWVLWRAQDVLEALPEQRREELMNMHALAPTEVARWDEISRRIYIPFHDGGIISQFEGYERLDEFAWDDYREKYGSIQRLDRILEAEGDSPNRYKASKQADVLMLLYLLSADELRALFSRLGYALEPETLPATVDYYLSRTAHGSTLSQLVHAWVLVRSDREHAWRLFREALGSDLFDVQGGTTAEGVHLGAMAGTVDLAQRGFSGLETRDDVLWLSPQLPEEMKRLRFTIRYRRHWGLEIDITQTSVRVTARPAKVYPLNLRINGELISLAAGESVERAL